MTSLHLMLNEKWGPNAKKSSTVWIQHCPSNYFPYACDCLQATYQKMFLCYQHLYKDL